MNFEDLIKIIEEDGYVCTYKYYEESRISRVMRLSFYDSINPYITLTISSEDLRHLNGGIGTTFKNQDFRVSFCSFIYPDSNTNVINIIKNARFSLDNLIRNFRYERKP